jgi:flagellar hook-basal body complex protein FliE
MADLSAVQAYQAAIRASQTTTPTTNDPAAGGINFGDMLSSAVQDTTQALQTAEQMTAASAVGDAELIDVVTAVSAAELSLETVVAVRDEVVRAYQEILRMPI